MKFSRKFKTAERAIKDMEFQYLQKIKDGSKDQYDYLELSYFSGLHNGFKFVWHIIDNSADVKEEDFDAMLKKILHLEEGN